MSPPAKDFDAYLSAVPHPARATLERVRQTIRSTVPDAVEAISYGMPTFKYGGKGLLGLSASKDHCSLHLMGYIPTELEADLEGYDTGKGTIRFPQDKPLPKALIRKIAKVRVAQVGSGKKR